MRIHYLINSLETGGAGLMLPRILDVVRGAGHAVDVTACEPGDLGSAPLLERAGITPRVLFDGPRGKLALIRAYRGVVRRDPADLVWTSLNRAAFIGLSVGARLDLPVVCWKNTMRAPVHLRMTAGRCRLWIADSTAIAEYLVRELRQPAERVATWPLFERTRFTGSARVWDGRVPLQLGSVGRLQPQKNYAALIEAIALLRARHPDLAGRLRLTIVGEGPLRPTLERLVAVRKLASVVSLPGAMNDVRPFLRTLHLYVQPSRFEGMCIAAHEAMSAGLPVIATDVGEMGHSIRAGGGGLVLPAGTAAACADAIRVLARDPARLAELGRRAEAYVEAKFGAGEFERNGAAVVARVERLLPVPA